jgi:RES domain-containing protein
VRFADTCYRAHDPRWSFKPLSGEGAALRGGRFNPKGVEALYLSLSSACAIKEANQGFAFKINACLLCSYEVDCADIADLRDEAGRAAHRVDAADMSCPWFAMIAQGREPQSWTLARRLIAQRFAGILVPSYAPGADATDQNLVLWKWSSKLPHRVNVYDPSGRLPKNQLSWD